MFRIMIMLSVFFGHLFCLYLEAKPLKVDVTSKSAILMNADTGAVLFEKNSHTPGYPASITKVATALYAIEKKLSNLDELVTASHDALSVAAPHIRRASNAKHPSYRLETGGSNMGIKVGESLPFKDLIFGLMLSSGNDAANVIAQYVSGDVPQFIEELNHYLKQMGCMETHFTNPHGLPHSNHITSPYDMALIAKRALKFPFFRDVVKTLKYVRPETNKQPSNILLQHNKLIKPGQYYYPKAIGIKTGYTSSAGYTLVAAAENEERTLIAVIMGCEDANRRFKEAVTLFETAFSEKKISRVLFAKDSEVFSLPIKGAKESLEATLHDDLKISYYPSEEPDFNAFLAWEPTKLPIAKGQNVGHMLVKAKDGTILQSLPLVATKDIEKTNLYTFKEYWSVCKAIAWKKRIALLSLMVCLTLSFLIYSIKKKPH